MNVGSRALRRRRKPSLATRLRIVWVFIVLVVGVAVYGGYVLVTLPALRPHPIDVYVHDSGVTVAQVVQAAQIDRASNVWLLDTAALARRIEALPYADAVVVQRTPPARLAIDVTVRTATRCVRAGGHAVTTDNRRRILETGCARPGLVNVDVAPQVLGVPGETIASPAVAALLADVDVLHRAELAVAAVRFDRFGQLSAEYHGLKLLFGSDADLAAKAKLVGPVLAAAPAGRPVRAVDLRAPATPIIEFNSPPQPVTAGAGAP